MIGQIERRKKGRPSKADLTRRAAAAAEEDGDNRRSSRKRSVRYNLDYDDYEEEEREEERRREKRLKVVLNESARMQSRRVVHAPLESDDDDVENEIDEETEVIERKAGTNDADSAPGTPSDLHADTALPDKNTLELILDKLQKKDTYGVYAEPVDPDELPDYYDVIEHPMDFGTVRKKLGKGLYSTLEQFESDVLLICSNAMQYNAPDTIYHKQALSIQELSKRKFQRLRSGSEQDEKELHSEQKPISNSLGNDKQIKKPISRIAPETVVSDLSSSATRVTLEENLQHCSKANESGLERPGNVDESIDGNATFSDNNLDKVEDLLPGRGDNHKFGKKPVISDENRRGTYELSTQPVFRPDTVFSTFNDEIKQLVAVGLHDDHSYARSLARFAATLGPVAWNIASKRIQQSLPPGIKFDRGWVGDYEPISTPVLINYPPKETIFHWELKSSSNLNRDDKIYNAINSPPKSPFIFSHNEAFSGQEVNTSCKPNRDVKIFNSMDSMHNNSFVTSTSEGKSTLSGAPVNTTVSGPTSYQVPSPRAKISQAEKLIKKGFISNSPPPSANLSPREFSVPKHNTNASIPSSESMEPLLQDKHSSVSVPLLQPQNNRFVEISQVANRKLPNNGFGIDRTVASVNDHSQMSMPKSYFSHGQEQGLTDPVQVMRKLTGNSQKQQKSTNYSIIDNPLVQHSRKEDPSNATSAAARAWMSIGAGNHKSVSENRNQIFVNSLHNPTQVSRFRNDFPVYPMNNIQVQGFMAPQFQAGNETQFQNRPQIVFPQLTATDLSHFQMQSSPRQHQRQESIPPDLNIVFQSSGSPRSQSSGVHMDSQQPDLALQL